MKKILTLLLVFSLVTPHASVKASNLQELKNLCEEIGKQNIVSPTKIIFDYINSTESAPSILTNNLSQWCNDILAPTVVSISSLPPILTDASGVEIASAVFAGASVLLTVGAVYYAYKEYRLTKSQQTVINSHESKILIYDKSLDNLTKRLAKLEKKKS